MMLEIDKTPKEVGVTLKTPMDSTGIPNPKGDTALHKLTYPIILRIQGIIPKTVRITKVGNEKRCLGTILSWQYGQSISITIPIHTFNHVS